jgi:hypothetical protein
MQVSSVTVRRGNPDKTECPGSRYAILSTRINVTGTNIIDGLANASLS